MNEVDKIIKALQICVNQGKDCRECIIGLKSGCYQQLMLKAVDTIERLNKFDNSQSYNMLIKVAEKNDVIVCLQSEIEQLKDSQPIICGECRHYNYLQAKRCALCNFEILMPDDYCSYAERKEVVK